jgi:hypothetical protein
MLMDNTLGESNKRLKRLCFRLIVGKRPFRISTGTPTNITGFRDIPQSLEENRVVVPNISPRPPRSKPFFIRYSLSCRSR